MSRVIANEDYSPEYLKNFFIFSGLNVEEINPFFSVMKLIHFDRDETILREGDIGHSILLLLEGEVEISQALTLKIDNSDVDTREKGLIKLSSSQYPFFGEMCLFTKDDKRSATVKAKTDCIVGRITKVDFFSICEKNPEVGYKVIKNIATVMTDRLKQANMNILKLSTAFSLLVDEIS
ncbi:MAG: cyclic nucleotide-binding domain-containing protein [Candidatus Marinimicrobia bacterium]|nr:cyclic nucleotide-binding domain-containing protein [Candidatus Neomarinimicrobiota bacterium]